MEFLFSPPFQRKPKSPKSVGYQHYIQLVRYVRSSFPQLTSQLPANQGERQGRKGEFYRDYGYLSVHYEAWKRNVQRLDLRLLPPSRCKKDRSVGNWKVMFNIMYRYVQYLTYSWHDFFLFCIQLAAFC